jgi:hypothetical protein
MGIGSPYFTRRFAAPAQNVLDQMQRNFPQEATAVHPSAQRPERPPVAAADHGGRLASTPAQTSAINVQTSTINSKIVIPSLPAQAGKATDLLLILPSAQHAISINSPAKAGTRQ